MILTPEKLAELETAARASVEAGRELRDAASRQGPIPYFLQEAVTLAAARLGWLATGDTILALVARVREIEAENAEQHGLLDDIFGRPSK